MLGGAVRFPFDAPQSDSRVHGISDIIDGKVLLAINCTYNYKSRRKITVYPKSSRGITARINLHLTASKGSHGH
jgi:hypothetical protein